MIVRSAAGVLLAGLAVVACRHDAERSGEATPYVVRVDVSLDGPSGIPALLAVLGTASPPLQRQLTWRLGGASDARAVEALAGLLAAPDPMVRAYAYDALVKLRDRGVEGAASAVAGFAGQKPLGPLSPPES
jgi:HEAT repeat protein